MCKLANKLLCGYTFLSPNFYFIKDRKLKGD